MCSLMFSVKAVIESIDFKIFVFGWVVTVLWWNISNRIQRKHEMKGILEATKRILPSGENSFEGIVVKVLEIKDTPDKDRVRDKVGIGRSALQELNFIENSFSKYREDILNRYYTSSKDYKRCRNTMEYLLELLDEEFYLLDTLIGHVSDVVGYGENESLVIRDLWCRGLRIKSTEELLIILDRVTSRIREIKVK